jgi:copper chaperone CopZ
MPRYPKGTSPEAARKAKGSEVKALFSVAGMTCAACAGSVEKAVKRLPGIQEAAVDVLNNTVLVLYYPSFVKVSEFSSCFSSNFLSGFFFIFFTNINLSFFFSLK